MTIIVLATVYLATDVFIESDLREADVISEVFYYHKKEPLFCHER